MEFLILYVAAVYIYIYVYMCMALPCFSRDVKVKILIDILIGVSARAFVIAYARPTNVNSSLKMQTSLELSRERAWYVVEIGIH